MKIFKTILFIFLVLRISFCEAQEKKPVINTVPKAGTLLSQAIVSEGRLDRLKVVFSKAAKGEHLVIGVIGGSITEGAACPDLEKRYPNVVLGWWKKTFPDASFELVNAGIGATGSNYGAMRVKRDLLSKKPDFVVVEYAVNDGNSRESAETLEGVVRQTLSDPSQPALMLLFMMKIDGSNAQEWFARVGRHYELPMISYRDALWPEIQAGRLKWSQISPDQVHPNETGHVFAGELISGFLDQALRKTNSRVSPAVKSAIPAPLISDSYEYTSLLEGETLIPLTNQNWEYDGSYYKSAGWKSAVPGSILEFEISGGQVFLSCWKIKGPMGIASVSVDEGNPVLVDSWFDQTWGGYSYMVPVARNLSQGKHKIRIELLKDKNVQSSGNEFRVLSVSSCEVRN